jgi:hypothetical protein
MDLRRLRIGEWITAFSGAALLVSLWLPWYSIAPGTASAWESLAALDVLLALAASTGVALLLITATQSVPAVPVAFSVFVTLAGMGAVILVLARLLSLPEGAEAREWGVWLALAASIGQVVGGLVAMRDERLSPPGRHTDQTGRPTAPPPDIETIRAPGP